MHNLNTIEKLYQMQKSRIVAFGSSNTECCYPQQLTHGWVNWLDYGLRKIFGRHFITINAGVSGQTSSQLLNRIEDDVILFKPQLVFITVGGNDSNPGNNLSPDQFIKNLNIIIKQLRDAGIPEIILQTYYNPIKEKLPTDYAKNFYQYMQLVRDVAKETNVILFDHLKSWQQLRENIQDEYEKKLMDDPMHLNALGNQLWGYDILDRLIPKEIFKIKHYFIEVEAYQNILKENR